MGLREAAFLQEGAGARGLRTGRQNDYDIKSGGLLHTDTAKGPLTQQARLGELAS
jgi:hypothetical protein